MYSFGIFSSNRIKKAKNIANDIKIASDKRKNKKRVFAVFTKIGIVLSFLR